MSNFEIIFEFLMCCCHLTELIWTFLREIKSAFIHVNIFFSVRPFEPFFCGKLKILLFLFWVWVALMMQRSSYAFKMIVKQKASSGLCDFKQIHRGIIIIILGQIERSFLVLSLLRSQNLTLLVIFH